MTGTDVVALVPWSVGQFILELSKLTLEDMATPFSSRSLSVSRPIDEVARIILGGLNIIGKWSLGGGDCPRIVFLTSRTT